MEGFKPLRLEDDGLEISFLLAVLSIFISKIHFQPTSIKIFLYVLDIAAKLDFGIFQLNILSRVIK